MAKWIAGLAQGGEVSLQGPVDPTIRAAFTREGISIAPPSPAAESAEFVVSFEPEFKPVGAAAQTVFIQARAENLPSLLREAAANGFLPEAGFDPPEFASDWLVLRRTDSILYGRMAELESTTADLEAERHRLRHLLRHTRRELRTVKTSPAWRAITWYREWLDRHRKRKWLPFRVYDRIAASVVRTRATGGPAVDENNRPDFPFHPMVPAARFTSSMAHDEDWDPIFRGLTAHNSLGSTSTSPRISIVTPLWNTKPAWLAEAAVSVFDQTSTEWEWCIVDDCSTDQSFQPVLDLIREATPRVKVKRLDRNRGISGASNEGLKMARGEFVCFLDHDDLLHPEAIEACLERLDKGCDAVYTDSNKANEEGICDEPFYKPDWSPEYFRGVMYVGHLLCVRRDGALALNGFDSNFDGVQDFEFFLRYSEQYRKIGHIPRILYHWRRVEGSTASATSAKKNITELQQRAVANQLRRLGLNARAVGGPRPHRVTVEPGQRRTSPRVSIIIPTKDAPDMLSTCLDSIFRLSTYQNLQVICADNDTTDEKALALMKRPRIDRVLCPGKFNYSRVNNESAQFADGEFLLFLNNDIEVITPDWIEQMLYHAEQEDVGAVGSLLLYGDRSVQHCGIALGFRGTADHILRGADSTIDGYAGSLAHAHECVAVTAACMMIRKSVFDELGGFDEHYFTAYQDVDLCLKLHARGKRMIYTPRAVLIHHESFTRKSYYDIIDRHLLLDSWGELIEAGDPYYSVNFNRVRTDYQAADDADAGEVPPHVSLWSFGSLDRSSRKEARAAMPASR
ncbi:MAG TPA: glycosyltransferase family 2 protein [Bryobacteraceae bacterium]